MAGKSIIARFALVPISIGMPKHLHFTTDQGPVAIALLDTEFVDFWLCHFLNMQPRYTLAIRPVEWPYLRPQDHLIPDLIQRTVDVANEINSLPGIAPLPEPVLATVLAKLDLDTQQFLNRLHRYLVTATELRDRWHCNGDAEFAWIPYDNLQAQYLLNLLNQTIHALEQYVMTPHRHEFNRFINSREVMFAASRYQDVNIYHDDVDLTIPDHLQQHLCLHGHDVWIKKDILGKDYITAFADHDDPRAHDVRPPPMISGGLMIDVDTSRTDFFQHPKFAAWLGEEPQARHGSYPLGDVVMGRCNLQQAKHIEFVGLE